MRKNKWLAVMMASALSVSAMSGCAKSSEDAATTTATSPEVATTTEAPKSEAETTVEATTEDATQEEYNITGYTYSGSDKVGSLTGKTSNEIVADMGFGFNIGNTLDATGGSPDNAKYHETSWGNPIVTQEFVDAIRDTGFNTVRIPTTWSLYISKDGTMRVDTGYLARVREVVDYCYQNDLYVILNIHHENWLNNKDLVNDKENISAILENLWMQIADYFADYDQHLIFEGMNEPRLAGTNIEWAGNEEAYDVVNLYNQLFVNAVRKSGKGHNDERCLMIPGYAASNSSAILNSINFPTVDGETVKNLIVSVHSYAPYDFCLSDSMKTFNEDDSKCTSAIVTMFDTLKTEFLSQNIPVVIGETSATNKDNTEERAKWATYMGKMAAGYGVPIVIWDNGSKGNSGGECHCYIDRETCQQNFPEVNAALMKSLKDTEWGSMAKSEDKEEEPTESLVDGQIILSFPEGKESTSQWDSSYINIAAKEIYLMGKKDIAMVFSSEKGQPKLILDSEAKQKWWIPIDPKSIETLGDKQVATFSGEDIWAALQENDIDAYSQLRNFMVIAADDDITMYEISSLGGSAGATFRVNGKNYYTGSEMPEDPKVDGFKFLGWYTTKNYEPGTEFTGFEGDSFVTVYAKLAFEK